MKESRIEIIRGDITSLALDAIVNAANSSLLGGGGVDGAIHRAVGKELVDECRTLHGCNTGDVKITKGYLLPAKYVIHTVGPVWNGGKSGEPELLASCYRKSLEMAERNGIRSMAFPAISCGIFGYPIELAAEIALREVMEWLSGHSLPERVVFCCFSESDAEVYRGQLASD